MTAPPMPPSSPMRLYRHLARPDIWIGEDPHGALVLWQRDGRWADRTPYTGGMHLLEECEPALARGTGWPGGGTGRRTRSPDGTVMTPRPIRVSDSQWEAWTRAAKREGKEVAQWVRDTCDEASRMTR